jgi:hypothetical protein
MSDRAAIIPTLIAALLATSGTTICLAAQQPSTAPLPSQDAQVMPLWSSAAPGALARQVASYLNSLGIAAFVLRSRLGQRYNHPVELGSMVERWTDQGRRRRCSAPTPIRRSPHRCQASGR